MTQEAEESLALTKIESLIETNDSNIYAKYNLANLVKLAKEERHGDLLVEELCNRIEKFQKNPLCFS